MAARVIHNESKWPTISVRNRKDTRSKPYDEQIARPRGARAGQAWACARHAPLGLPE
jgi:hypothetical protein